MNKNKTLELVTFNYYPNNSKNIEIELLFKNDAIIKLETEIIRCKLEDQGEPWNIEKIENKAGKWQLNSRFFIITLQEPCHQNVT